MPLDQMQNDPRDSRYDVFVSALLSPLGNEAIIVLAIQQGLIKPYFSEEMLEE
jgi:hypothetical protein